MHNADWQEVALGNAADVNPESIGVNTPPHTRIRYIDISSVTPGQIEWGEVKEIEFQHAPSRARRIVREGDSIFCTVRPALQAHASVESNHLGNLVCSTGFAVLRPRELHARFLYHTLFSDYVNNYVVRHEIGSNYPAINEGDLQTLQLLVPTREVEQARIGQVLDTLDALVRQMECKIAKLRQIKAGLLQDLLTCGLDADQRLNNVKEASTEFQQASFGRIPAAWKEVTFGSLVKDVTLGTTRRGKSNIGANLPLLKMGNLGWGKLDLRELELLDDRVIVNHPQLKLSPGDFLFNTRNTPELVGKTAVWAGELSHATFDNNLLRVRFKAGVESRFVCMFMSQGVGRQKLQNLVSATTSVAAIYWRSLANFTLPLAPPQEQTSICDKVENLNLQILKEQRELSKLRALKRGLAEDLLTGRVRVKV